MRRNKDFDKIENPQTFLANAYCKNKSGYITEDELPFQVLPTQRKR